VLELSYDDKKEKLVIDMGSYETMLPKKLLEKFGVFEGDSQAFEDIKGISYESKKWILKNIEIFNINFKKSPEWIIIKRSY
jgi:hypothetical protein